MAPPLQRQNTRNPAATWRDLMFGDYRYDTHLFVEKVLTRAPKEIGCAFTAAFLVSPLVSIIDKCIVQDVASTAKLMTAMGVATKDMVMQPGKFLGGLSFRLTLGVYFGTYAVANLAEMFLDSAKVKDDEKRFQIKVSAASVANISLLAWRDAIFARVFSADTGKVKPAAPWRTISMFAVRDASTMYATFYAAPRAAEYLQDKHGVDQNVAELSMAIGIPVITQILTAPIHIYGLDYYNNRVATTAERFAMIRKEFGPVSFARGLRILPAFGIGSFSNNKLREMFIEAEDWVPPLERGMDMLMTNSEAEIKAA